MILYKIMWLLIRSLRRNAVSCLLLSIVINFLREKLHVEFIEEEDLYDLVSMGFNKLRIPRCLRNR